MPTVRTQELETLRNLPFFSEISPRSLEKLTQGALLQRFPAGTQLFDQGEEPDFLHVLLEGSVQLLAVGGDGREVLVEILVPVDAFVLAAALTGKPYLMRARVNETARILLLPAHVLRRQILAEPELAVTMLASLATQFRRMVRQIKNLKLRTATQRVGCYLLALAAESPQRDRVRLPYDKQLIASHLGMTRESLSRALAALKEQGVETRGADVRLHDLEALSAFCQPDRLIDGTERALTIEAD